MNAMTGAFYVLSAYLAAVLLASSLAKFVDRGEFARILTRQGLLPEKLVPSVSWSLPALELGISFGLACGVAVPLLASATLCLFILFLAATVTLVVQGKDAQCGCFGVVFKERIDAATIVRDFGFVGIAAVYLWLAVTVSPAIPALNMAMGCAAVTVTIWALVASATISRTIARGRRRELEIRVAEAIQDEASALGDYALGGQRAGAAGANQ